MLLARVKLLALTEMSVYKKRHAVMLTLCKPRTSISVSRRASGHALFTVDGTTMRNSATAWIRLSILI
jgi:hypothetical protein